MPVTTLKRKNFNLYDCFLGACSVAFAVACLLALVSYSSSDPSFSHITTAKASNLLSVVGSYTADFLLQTIGGASVLMVLVPSIWGIKNIIGYNINFFWIRFILLLSAIISLSLALTHFNLHALLKLPIISFGGALGTLIQSSSQIFAHKFALHAELAATAVLLYLSLDIEIRSVYICLRALTIFIYNSSKSIAKFIFNLSKVAINKLHGKSSAAQEIEEAPLDIENLPMSIEADDATIDKLTRKRVTHKHFKDDSSSYSLPPSDLLQGHKQNKVTISESTLKNNSTELIKTLNDFGVQGKIDSYFPGPVVTLYEFEPSAGTKSSRVVGLSDDIARTMKAISTRVAIIPGKNSLGIELPNATREIVYLRELIESDEYASTHHKLPIILGKDIGGKVSIVDLCEMPHLLVAGTTGSGKSVAINTMILSLLFKHSPDTCKFIMIDPKMLELSVYEGIPHLLAPVVTESHKAISTMKWVVKEMENRYRLMSHLGVRNIHGFNQRIQDGVNLKREVQVGFDDETGDPVFETITIENKILPFIVVIVDEMADLMIVSGKEIEASVQRVAQMARAAGIHIIMATQRPSVDVITGVIKANFPSRIAFQVSSKIDSRTILGEMGAEQLLGKGDMLYMSSGNKIKRVHGPFVGDGEISNVVSFLKSQGKPSYRTDIMLTQKSAESSFDQQDYYASNSGDDLYDQAVNFVRKDRRISTSYLQRQFKIGYNRAASIVERMEKEGIISSPNHIGKREVLVDE